MVAIHWVRQVLHLPSNTYTLFFFQFAFTATATTIATGSMAGITDFIGNLIYSAIMGAIAYPIVVPGFGT